MQLTKPKTGRVTVAFLNVLSVFLSAPNKKRSGADIMKETKLKSGTVYPLLARLVTNGWLDASWEKIDPEVEGRPPRRLYTLTKGGHREALSIMQEQVSYIPNSVLETGLAHS